MADSGGLPIRPGDLDGFWDYEKHDIIIKRAKFLVNGDLEVPHHIREALRIIKERQRKNGGPTWSKANEKEICQIVDQVAWDLHDKQIWKRSPKPSPDSDPYELTKRILISESVFYGNDSESPGSRLLYMIRDARKDPNPKSFLHQLNQAGVTIDKVVNFTRKTLLGGDPQHLSLPLRLDERRELFVADLARFMSEMRGGRRGLPHATYEIPAKDDSYIEDAIMKIDSHTLVFDTTLNSTILQTIQEAGFKPGVIMMQLTFWPDGADADPESAKSVSPMNYKVYHWLSEHYNVFARHPGSGFVTCNPTIYILKKDKSLGGTLRRSLSRGDPKKG
ncbi:hypothetical protein MFIFM68171_08251 [Madurella fahalii]|uniref:Uncharacterized protein n=1 Tax=Madurella fahalii TaxID=1157608 RepID=A0ABQ0GJX8_9PEZI